MQVYANSNFYFGSRPKHDKSQPGSMETYSLETISQLAVNYKRHEISIFEL